MNQHRAIYLAALVAFFLLIDTRPDTCAQEPLEKGLGQFDEGEAIRWYPATTIGVEGQAWRDTQAPFDRLPARAEGVVRPPVWNLSRQSAGLAVRFVTNATQIRARWTLTSANLAMPHMPATGVSGLDLYARHPDGGWRWVANARPSQQSNVATLIAGLSAQPREYLLYAPLYNGLKSLDIGIPDDGTIQPPPPRPVERRKPMVFWGTSITQGGCASRPGMVHTSILGRRFDRDVINLGFSGNGKMEPEMARFIAEIDAAVFIVDCLPNMDAVEVSERAAEVVRILREKHPATPIVLAEDRSYTDAWLVESKRARNQASRAALRKVFEQLQSENVPRLYYLTGDEQLGDDGEATVDSSHPTDLGFVRMADSFAKHLESLLGE